MRTSPRYHLTLVALLALISQSMTTTPVAAADQSVTGEESRPDRSFRDFAGSNQPFSRGSRPSFGYSASPFRDRPGKEITDGYLIIEREYVEPPYTLELSQEQLLVNGSETNIPAAQLLKDQSPSEPKQRRWHSYGVDQNSYGFRVIADRLRGGEVVILSNDSPPMTLSTFDGAIEVLRAFSSDTSREELLAREDWSFLSSFENPAQWKSFLAEFESPPTLAARAAARVAELDLVAYENESHARAMRRLNQWAYPLTLIGMVLVVAAFGHLLSSAPRRTDQKVANSERSVAVRALLYSLGLVIALSALDFTWTLLNSQAGQMREMNPLARGLIDQPMQLLAFKVTITALAIGIMLVLRRYRPAQIGAWWACLICTLLTARWLVLDSMMV